MKKMLIVLLAGLLMLTAVACKKEAEKPVEESVEAAQAETMTGGWTPAADCAVTEARKAIFDKGMAILVGVDYTPVAYLGSQVVAGTNHAFLVKGSVVVPEAPVSYALVYLYEDLSGNVKVLSIADLPIVPQENGTLAAVETGLMGGWAYAEDPTVTEEMAAKLEKALEKNLGATYVPVANLGTQVVAGLNRCLLVQVTPVVPNARPHYALAYIYTDLEGNSSLTQVIDLDVGAYCTYGA